MNLRQEVNHVISDVDEEQRDDSVELALLRELLQEVALDELDGSIGPVVWHRQRRVPRGGIGLMRPLGDKGLQLMLVQRGRVVRQKVVGQDGAVVQLIGRDIVPCAKCEVAAP